MSCSCWLRRDRLHSNAWHKVLRCLPIADASAATPLLSDPSPPACNARPPSGYSPRSGRGEPFRCEACIIGAVVWPARLCNGPREAPPLHVASVRIREGDWHTVLALRPCHECQSAARRCVQSNRRAQP